MTDQPTQEQLPGIDEPVHPSVARAAANADRIRQAAAAARSDAARKAAATRKANAHPPMPEPDPDWTPGPPPEPGTQVVPAQITWALDSRGLYGKYVDLACGAAEPDVDEWETGERVPTAEQVLLLARLTGYPVRRFYEQVAPGVQGGPMYICSRRRCERVEPDVVDERGVVHRAGEEPAPPAGPARLF